MSDQPELQPAYLICGSDVPKVRRAVARLRRRVFDETASDLNIIYLDARTEPAAAALQIADTPTFTLGTRLVIVTAADKWAAAERERVATYLDDPAPGVCLMLVGDEFKKTERSPSCSRSPRSGAALRSAQAIRADGGWAREQAKARGARLGANEARYLIAQVGADPELLETEIDEARHLLRAARAITATISMQSARRPSRPVSTSSPTRSDAATGAAAFRILESLFAAGGRASDDVARSAICSLVKYVASSDR